MLNIFRKLFIAFINLILISNIYCQQDGGNFYPVIGKKCPEVYFHKDSSLEIFSTSSKQRPMIIDFFSLGCVSCFASFPKMNELYLKYRDRIDFILVGREHRLIRKSFQLYKSKYNLQIPVAFDSLVFDQFKISGVPFVIFIDENGIVKAITNEVVEDNLKKLLAGEAFRFYDISYDSKFKETKGFDSDKPFLLYGNGGADSSFFQRSLVSFWKDGDMKFDYGDMLSFQEGKKPLQMLGHPLVSLYRMAYFGTYLPWAPMDTERNGKISFSPLVRIRDASLFKLPYYNNPKFNYSLILPEDKMNRESMMEIMQKDLENFFGFKAHFETRTMPYLKMTATKHARKTLRSKSDTVTYSQYIFGIELQNSTVESLISAINYNFALVYNNLPLIDKTRIKNKIDIKIEAAMTDWTDVIRSLNKNGLDIKKGRKKMKVLIIEQD